ncbi:heme o synthase [Rubripirellula amarantea]|uniref:Protoheme IX farnesyltransferase n=1 Tax=Rubripirellula amarantea TaxID=2527999 RepID=A0A5C5WTK2_9BACT|nr:heme o synthase [Rubripirellula amarantea]MDA8746164.1 heme o synthase [Rubripirellula amarantea]TWT53172.1 Protoheme IX farnesyltransferase [Rubripirellula amarantea]
MATDLLMADELTTGHSSAEKMVLVGQGTLQEETTSSDFASTQSRVKMSAKAIAKDFVELTKPRIVTMILVTTVATALMGAGGFVPAMSLVWLLIGTGMVAGSAGAANQVWERVIDQEMTRTASRPLPSGRMSLTAAMTFTAAIGIIGTTILWQFFGMVPAMCGVVTWLTYVVVYTPMKTRTSWNTTVGAIAGALPVLIGYTACGGALSDASGWLLVGILVAWQYPHFMAIAWLYRRQYDEAGFQMSTTVEPTGLSAAIQAIVGSLVLIACGIALCFIRDSGFLAYLASMLVFASVYPMLKASVLFFRSRDDITGRKLLRSSLLVLPAVLLIVTLRVFW